MKYFKFCKTLLQSLVLIEVSKEPMTAESDKIVVLSEEELKSFTYELFFICCSRDGRFIKKDKKVKTGKAFLKHFNLKKINL
jgi:hypothetical protein